MKAGTFGLLFVAAWAAGAHADYRVNSATPDQDRILEALSDAAEPGAVFVFDLDGTLLDNRPRQVAILRAWASREGITDLEDLRSYHFQEWGLDDALRRAGLSADRVRELRNDARRAWSDEFWTDEALVHDRALPGAARFVRQLHDRGALIRYVGRRSTQAAGTLASLERLGFPLDERAQFVPEDLGPEGGRDAARAARDSVLRQVARAGQVVGVFENDATVVDRLRRLWDDATVVQVRTDGPQFPHSTGPVVRGFLRTTDPAPRPEAPDRPLYPVPTAGVLLDVIAISDGDTITVREPIERGGWVYTIRLIGIDTPEKDGLYGEPFMAGKERRHREHYGDRLVDTEGAWRDAQEYLIEALEGRRVFLRYDEANAPQHHRDSTSSHRVLAYVYAADPDRDPIDINAELCRRGFTYDYGPRYPHRRDQEFSRLIEDAQDAHRGYWSPRYQPFK